MFYVDAGVGDGSAFIVLIVFSLSGLLVCGKYIRREPGRYYERVAASLVSSGAPFPAWFWSNSLIYIFGYSPTNWADDWQRLTNAFVGTLLYGAVLVTCILLLKRSSKRKVKSVSSSSEVSMRILALLIAYVLFILIFIP